MKYPQRLARIVDYESETQVPTPLQSFTDHTLPITSLHIGIGILTSSRIFSSSLDSTLKIWCIDAHTQSESPDPTFTLLITWSLPHPIGELVVDPLERFLFAASAGDGGEIWCVRLFTEKKEKMSARSLVNGNMGETLTPSTDKTIIVGYEMPPPPPPIFLILLQHKSHLSCVIHHLQSSRGDTNRSD